TFSPATSASTPDDVLRLFPPPKPLLSLTVAAVAAGEGGLAKGGSGLVRYLPKASANLLSSVAAEPLGVLSPILIDVDLIPKGSSNRRRRRPSIGLPSFLVLQGRAWSALRKKRMCDVLAR